MKTKIANAVRYDVKVTDRMMFEFDGNLYHWLYQIYYKIASIHRVDITMCRYESEMVGVLLKNGIEVYCDGELL